MQINVGTVGAQLNFTAKIPADVAAALERRDGAHAAMGLTPNWGSVPELAVRSIRRANVEVPSHWRDDDVVVPLISGQAFYIGDINLGGGAVSFSMKGVNLRTGRPETEGPLSDDPSQGYWALGVDLPWIDGFVPADGQAVLQFVPLRGVLEMASDVSRYVGISPADPFIDALRARFFAPVEPPRPPRPVMRGGHSYGTLGGLESFGGSGGGLESMVSKSATSGWKSIGGTRSVRGLESFEAEEVGMGAGARMAQCHEHNPHAKASDYRPAPWLEVVFRLAWVEEWNALARTIGEPTLDGDRLRDLDRQQASYEASARRRLGIFQHVITDVDGFPTAP